MYICSSRLYFYGFSQVFNHAEKCCWSIFGPPCLSGPFQRVLAQAKFRGMFRSMFRVRGVRHESVAYACLYLCQDSMEVTC